MLIDAGIAAVAVARSAEFLDAELQRGEARLVADFLSGDLVGGNARAEIRAGRLASLSAREECGGSAGMIAGAVAVGAGFIASQAGENHKIALDRRERLQDGRQLVISPFLCR